MAITETADLGIELSIASLIIDDRLMDLRLCNPDSSKNMLSLPWEDAE